MEFIATLVGLVLSLSPFSGIANNDAFHIRNDVMGHVKSTSVDSVLGTTVASNTQPVLTTLTLPNARADVGYTAYIGGYDVNGDNDLTLTVDGLSSDYGFKLGECVKAIDASNRKTIKCPLYGLESLATVHTYTVNLENDKGGKTHNKLRLAVENIPPVINTASLPHAAVGKLYKTTVIGSDPNKSDYVVLSFRDLPGWLSKGACTTNDGSTIRNEARCIISGTPTVVGTNTFVVRVTDPYGGEVERKVSVIVDAVAAPTPTPVLYTLYVGVVIDTNANGYVDNLDQSYPGSVPVTLTNNTKPEPDKTVMTTNGSYAFTNLTTGYYTVKFTVPSGYKAITPTTANADVSPSNLLPVARMLIVPL